MELPVSLADELFTDLSMSVDCEMRTAYSGRGMFGQTCLGFVTSEVGRLSYHLGILMAEWQPNNVAWSEVDAEALVAAFANAATDDMGLDRIVYYPDIRVVP